MSAQTYPHSQTRKEYLEGLALDRGITLQEVLDIAAFLPESEDFDGLITALDDYVETLEDR